MLAISGAHVSYLVLGITFLLEKSKTSKRKRQILLICFLVFFMALVGFTPSATRACIMAILQLLASLCFRKSDVYTNLAIASLLIVIANPYSILDIGFQLSFGGTIGIIVFYQPILQWMEKQKAIHQSKTTKQQNIVKQQGEVNKKYAVNNKLAVRIKELLMKMLEDIKQTILVTIAANLVIFPIMIYHFNNLSTIFLVSNLLASPILAISIILSLLVICFSFLCLPLAKLLAYFLTPILQLLTKIAGFTGNVPFANLLVPTPSIEIIIFYYFLLLFFVKKQSIKATLRKKVSHTFIIFTIIIILIKAVFSMIPSPTLKIFLIDVGQGDSILIQTPHHQNILIDGGGSEFGSFDVGKQVLLPYLLDKKITTIDYMMFSHFDSDHCQRTTFSLATNQSQANSHHEARKKFL